MTTSELKTHLTAAFDDGADRELAFKSMFGGACAYVNGRVFAWLMKKGLALKIDGKIAESWFEDGARVLQFDPDGPTFKSYLVVPADVLKDDEELGIWVEQSAKFVLSLPASKERPRRKRTA